MLIDHQTLPTFLNSSSPIHPLIKKEMFSRKIKDLEHTVNNNKIKNSEGEGEEEEDELREGGRRVINSLKKKKSNMKLRYGEFLEMREDETEMEINLQF